MALVLDWGVEDSVVRSDSRGFAVAGSFSQCAFAWIVCWRPGPVLRNGLSGAGSTRSADTVDGQSPQWLDCVPCAGPLPRRCSRSGPWGCSFFEVTGARV